MRFYQIGSVLAVCLASRCGRAYGNTNSQEYRRGATTSQIESVQDDLLESLQELNNNLTPTFSRQRIMKKSSKDQGETHLEDTFLDQDVLDEYIQRFGPRMNGLSMDYYGKGSKTSKGSKASKSSKGSKGSKQGKGTKNAKHWSFSDMAMSLEMSMGDIDWHTTTERAGDKGGAKKSKGAKSSKNRPTQAKLTQPPEDDSSSIDEELEDPTEETPAPSAEDTLEESPDEVSDEIPDSEDGTALPEGSEDGTMQTDPPIAPLPGEDELLESSEEATVVQTLSDGRQVLALPDFQLTFRLQDENLVPLRGDFIELTEGTSRFLREYMTQQWKDSDVTELDDFLTQFGTTSPPDKPLVVTFQPMAIFKSTSLVIPDPDEIQDLVQQAFAGYRLTEYLTLLEELPGINVFALTVDVDYMVPQESESTSRESIGASPTAITAAAISVVALALSVAIVNRRGTQFDGDEEEDTTAKKPLNRYSGSGTASETILEESSTYSSSHPSINETMKPSLSPVFSYASTLMEKEQGDKPLGYSNGKSYGWGGARRSTVSRMVGETSSSSRGIFARRESSMSIESQSTRNMGKSNKKRHPWRHRQSKAYAKRADGDEVDRANRLLDREVLHLDKAVDGGSSPVSNVMSSSIQSTEESFDDEASIAQRSFRSTETEHEISQFENRARKAEQRRDEQEKLLEETRKELRRIEALVREKHGSSLSTSNGDRKTVPDKGCPSQLEEDDDDDLRWSQAMQRSKQAGHAAERSVPTVDEDEEIKKIHVV